MIVLPAGLRSGGKYETKRTGVCAGYTTRVLVNLTMSYEIGTKNVTYFLLGPGPNKPGPAAKAALGALSFGRVMGSTRPRGGVWLLWLWASNSAPFDGSSSWAKIVLVLFRAVSSGSMVHYGGSTGLNPFWINFGPSNHEEQNYYCTLL